MRFPPVKLLRRADAWVKRIRMSPTRLWIVVEGVNWDGPFYESLANLALPSDVMVGIQPVSLIEQDGTAQGGKAAVLSLYERYRREAVLTWRDGDQAVDVMFAVDRDDDDFLGIDHASRHVMVTVLADIESEVVHFSALELALSSAFSVPRALLHDVDLSAVHLGLFDRWQEWIVLRLACARARVHPGRFAQESQVHGSDYSPTLDASKFEAIVEEASARCGTFDEHLDAARNHAARGVDDERAVAMVKGKWLPNYLYFLIAGIEWPLQQNRVTAILAACLQSVDFSHEYTAVRRRQIAEVAA